MTSDLSKRLAQAIGPMHQAKAAERAGVAHRTVQRILSGGSGRRTSLVRLARALDVNEDWLINGAGPMRQPQLQDAVLDRGFVVQGPTMPIEHAAPAPNVRSVDPRLFPTIDIDLAARALRTADELFERRGATPTPRERVQAMTLIYDALLSAETKTSPEDEA